MVFLQSTAQSPQADVLKPSTACTLGPDLQLSSNVSTSLVPREASLPLPWNLSVQRALNKELTSTHHTRTAVNLYSGSKDFSHESHNSATTNLRQKKKKAWDGKGLLDFFNHYVVKKGPMHILCLASPRQHLLCSQHRLSVRPTWAALQGPCWKEALCVQSFCKKLFFYTQRRIL